MKTLPLLLALLIFSKITIACSCIGYEANFYKNLSANQYHCVAVFESMELTTGYYDQITQTGYYTLIDTIQNNFNTPIGDTIIVYGGNGVNCGADLSQFTPGDTIILALGTTYYDEFDKEEFFLDGLCGVHYLTINDEQNEGSSLEEIKHRVNTILKHIDFKCHCSTIFPNTFYDNVAEHDYHCLAVFQESSYQTGYAGQTTQMAHFLLLDTLNNIDIPLEQSIVVVGADDLNCGENFNLFSTGDTMFLALSKSYYYPYQQDTFYLEGSALDIYGCGPHYLKVSAASNSPNPIDEVSNTIRSIITSIEETFLTASISLYPNPTETIFRIESPAANIQRVSIFDVSGKTIRDTNNINTTYFDGDLSHFPTGIYYAQIYTDKGNSFKKIVKK